MEQWLIYGLIAAFFIAIRDIFSKDLINRYEYIEYILYANIIVFICTIIYIYLFNISFQELKIPNKKDLLIIFLRILVIYLIIEPSIFYSLKYCDNLSYAKSIINLNTLFLFLLSIYFLKSKFNGIKFLGVILIFLVSYCIQK